MMSETEIKALVSLLDDEDGEIKIHIERQIRNLGGVAIPYLEDHWEESSLNPILQKRLEDLIHDLQYNLVVERITDWKKNGADDLLEGLWIVATYQYPDLNIEKLRTYIHEMYFDAWLEFRDDMHPHDQVRVLNQVFFEKHKFTSNTKNFHSPTNSMINQVFDLKKGNPISLCVIYILVAQRLGVPIFGVNLPSLFVVTYKSSSLQFYINIFNKGLIFSKIDIDNYIKQLNLAPVDTFYQPCSNLDIVRRFLRNLLLSFERNSDIERMKEVEAILRAIME
jgi:regulator of sirC expression with transglutaminase-like and TPR domain